MSDTQPVIRPFVFDRDKPFADRILLEVGWQKPGDPAERVEARARLHAVADAYVAELAGEPECFVTAMPGTIRYRDRDLAFVGVTGVVTSRVARKQGLASRTTARALAAGAENGAVVAGLGIFDQGFYDKLGFGTGGYEHFATIDPSTLNVPYCSRVPVRLTPDDFPEIHAARLARRRGHGAVSLDPPETTLLLTTHATTSFGLGFRDDAGTLTHHIWVHSDGAGHGPYRVLWASFGTVAEYIELLGLLRNLGDQVYLVWLSEPFGVQIQDFLDRPFRRHEQGRRGEYETRNLASANYQYRLLDVERAFGAASACCRLPRFRMRVTDPASRYLHAYDGWRGVAGDYDVSPAGAKRLEGADGDPDLTISVGDLTRIWLGVVPSTTLRDTGRIDTSADLAGMLDDAFGGPSPRTDWLY